MSDVNYKLFPEYTIDLISNSMSLRKPQKKSVEILESILNSIELSKDIDLESAKNDIKDVFPIFKDFEHNFVSLTFALATGVGKTKLMGAFITYLYTNKGVRNFFVVAPNLTIYSKLKNDLGNPSPDNEKYVFRGVSCFSTKKPNIWSDDDYRNRPEHALGDSDSINIFIFNISKFNSDERNMMSINEYLGKSFFDYLKSLDDLVLIMDESHHYRAKAAAQAINTLNPVLGLELTATPEVQSGSHTLLFKNVVYEYALSQAIRDGYTRTPYALARQDFNFRDMDPDTLDKNIIGDAIKHHKNIKAKLTEYATTNNVKLVKPFMLIVCKDTAHAQKIYDYIKSDNFQNGDYKNKVVIVHSNQRGEEKEENIQLLLEVEKANNPIEIVVHVNILKEGWDVNNLYTIVPLRTATSKVLREQTIGRGLRLPYGKRVGVKEVDSVVLTAHDKFEEVLAESQREDSIFKTGGIIYADYEQSLRTIETQLQLIDDNADRNAIIQQAGLDINNMEHRNSYDNIMSSLSRVTSSLRKNKPDKAIQAEALKKRIIEDLGETYKESEVTQRLVEATFDYRTDEILEAIATKVLYIPQIKVEELGEEKYIVKDFDLDMTNLIFTPPSTNILIRNLIDSRERTILIKGDTIDYGSIRPESYLVENISSINEIDYEKCPKLIQKLVMQFLKYYRSKYKESDVCSVILAYKRSITDEFKRQLVANIGVTYPGLVERVEGIKTNIVEGSYAISGNIYDLNQEPGEHDIKSIVYSGGSKSLTRTFKFDSNSERIFAQACENSIEVISWLKPARLQFNITYNKGHNYVPDFVVETNDMYYLVEVKARNQMNDPVVQAKKDRAIKYCKVASEYNLAHGHKAFKYIFIPHDEIAATSSFNSLKTRFLTEN